MLEAVGGWGSLSQLKSFQKVSDGKWGEQERKRQATDKCDRDGSRKLL